MSRARRRHPSLPTASALCLVVGLGVAGCSRSPSAAPGTPSNPATTATGAAPCTKAVLRSAITAAPDNNLIALTGFGCSGGWAWAGVTLGTSAENSFDGVMVLRRSGGSWHVADRATACNQHRVPAAIYTMACTTS